MLENPPETSWAIRLAHDLATNAWWRHAILGGLAIAAVCSLLSVYVVLKRMAFIGQGISHSALGGIALGWFLFAGTAAADAKAFVTALLFCIGVAFLIGATTRQSRISEDSAIGIFFVASMALGAILLKMIRGYAPDVYGLLFGSILAMTRTDLAGIVLLALVVAVPLLLLQKELLFYTFDENMAQASGLPVALLHYLLLTLLSVTIVVSAKFVGILLVSAFLILPGATAHLLTTRFRTMLVLSVAFGLLTTLAGLLASDLLDWPSGPSIVMVQFGAFLAAFALRRLRGDLTA